MPKKNNHNKLGRITSLGPQEPWQVALLLPLDWIDYRAVTERFHPAERIVLRGRMAFDATTDFHKGVPRLRATVEDAGGTHVGFTLFGDHRETAELLSAGTPITVAGAPAKFSERWYLNQAEIVPPEWIGRLCPRYPGKKRVIKPESVRERVLALLPEILPEAQARLQERMSAHADPEAVLAHAGIRDLRRALLTAHLPRRLSHGRQAQEAIERLVAMVAVSEAHASHPVRAQARAIPADPERVRERISRLLYPLTDEQQQAVEEIVEDMRQAAPMRRILSGDVGTGKTFVYAAAAAAVADHGGRAAILAPTQPLAAQVAEQIRACWPDLATMLVTGDDSQGAEQARILIGTTALLFRDLGKLDLVVVDEQQKFSREQREKLTEGGVHLLEVSGTCIPRSMALIRYGVWDVSKLTQAHTEKHIRSRIWEPEERAKLMESIRATISRGGQVLVIYPLKDGEERRSAEGAYEQWAQLFPDRVRLAHAGMSDADKQDAIDALKGGKADILVATTVAEVGLDLPRIRHVVVIEPQRLGLTQLHQIRGRAARHGGAGYFSMFLRERPKEKSMQRLRVMLETTDGFEIARRDLELRGYGSLRSDADRQSGEDDLLYGRPVRMEVLDAAAAQMERSLA
ncbi:DEAD/DEAH box helicase [Thioalkalivibrio thiocyanodenitrificans]|uniref:DEAD/DEAH box helicase n=1 Tax=Thioalkalivibrio thiocyanodenitrificans TaxID=243063 RepID=UPI00035C5918|nr:DEAD/DEAH box helicase [Thioalkalivibrio thiocyanodenitrificans]